MPWKKRLAVILAAVGAIAVLANPDVGGVSLGGIVGAVVNGAIWYGIGWLIGTFIDRRKERKASEPSTGRR